MEDESRPKRKHRTASEKADLVAAFLRSGLSQRDFALQQSLAPSNLQRWVRQSQAAADPNGQAALVEVPNLLGRASTPALYWLRWPKGVVLELSRGFEPQEVRQLAELVQSL